MTKSDDYALKRFYNVGYARALIAKIKAAGTLTPARPEERWILDRLDDETQILNLVNNASNELFPHSANVIICLEDLLDPHARFDPSYIKVLFDHLVEHQNDIDSKYHNDPLYALILSGDEGYKQIVSMIEEFNNMTKFSIQHLELVNLIEQYVKSIGLQPSSPNRSIGLQPSSPNRSIGLQPSSPNRSISGSKPLTRDNYTESTPSFTNDPSGFVNAQPENRTDTFTNASSGFVNDRVELGRSPIDPRTDTFTNAPSGFVNDRADWSPTNPRVDTFTNAPSGFVNDRVEVANQPDGWSDATRSSFVEPDKTANRMFNHRYTWTELRPVPAEKIYKCAIL
jgi:hypothetical protein